VWKAPRRAGCPNLVSPRGHRIRYIAFRIPLLAAIATLALVPGLAAGATVVTTTTPWALTGLSPNGIAIDASAVGLALPGLAAGQDPGPVNRAQHRDILIASDMWARTPRIMGMALNFTDIIGVPGLDVSNASQTLDQARSAVLASGGAWNDDVTCNAPAEWSKKIWAYTTAVGTAQYVQAWGGAFNAVNWDVVQVQFSWPPRPSTLQGTDFLVTLNDGTTVVPDNATVGPNFEYNEGTTVVLNGPALGNRLPKSDPGARYPVSVKVVADATPLQLVGSKGRLASAVGLTGTNDRTPYDDQPADPTKWTGPRMIAAKITRMSTAGEGGPLLLANGKLPNDGVAIFGAANAQYRVRIATLGGAFSPDGLRAMYPNEYRSFFQLVARTKAGRLVRIIKSNHRYLIDGEPITVVGIAERTMKARPDRWNQCLQDDSENQIDIVLKGSKAGMRKLVAVRVPAKGNGYKPLYNDGGPGSTPAPGTRYTAPSPRQTMRLINGLDNPLQATFIRRR